MPAQNARIASSRSSCARCFAASTSAAYSVGDSRLSMRSLSIGCPFVAAVDRL
jgi:hypothetical protein